MIAIAFVGIPTDEIQMQEFLMTNRKYDRFGVMIDMSRNSVMSVEALKRYLPLLKKMGYNMAMLYTEDTYEVDGEPYFGYMRGRYSKEEMKEIDAFASSIGIEMIPCMQTLAHLNATIRWGTFPVDCNDILLVDDPRTYELIDHMFATLSECFSSRLIHIGMDEAHMLGRGAFLDRHGYEKASAIIKRHLAKVEEIAAKYGYKCLLWSDMFFRIWNGGGYYTKKAEIPQDVVDSVSPNVIPVFWDYYHTDKSVYDDMLYNHRQLAKETWFAGGAWCWEGVTPLNGATLNYMLPALRACKENKVKNVFMTMWGDNGGECSHFAQLPVLFYLAEFAKGNEDEDKIKEKFLRKFGVDFDDFMFLDAANLLDGVKGTENPAKYMLFSDYFNDFLDYTVNPSEEKKYAEYAAKLHADAKKYRKYSYLFDTQAKLCDVLAVKYTLGYKTRKAYEAKDRETLRSLAENEYKEVLRRVRLFHAAFEKQWFTDNKTCGFDVQDLRLGGLLQRTESCRRRILDYVNGKIPVIEELEEKLLPYGNRKEGEPILFNNFEKNASTNVF